VSLLASVLSFSSLVKAELFAEGAGAEDAGLWRDLGRSCNWVRARPRLKYEQKSKSIIVILLPELGLKYLNVLAGISSLRDPSFSDHPRMRRTYAQYQKEASSLRNVFGYGGPGWKRIPPWKSRADVFKFSPGPVTNWLWIVLHLKIWIVADCHILRKKTTHSISSRSMQGTWMKF